VADIYDALTSDRPYRGGMPADDAIAIMQKDAGTALCARSVDAARDLAKSGAWTMQLSS
jgi:HD-GYP domain-containing protein (c-di-GMP phosphodiesterase class II)